MFLDDADQPGAPACGGILRPTPWHAEMAISGHHPEVSHSTDEAIVPGDLPVCFGVTSATTSEKSRSHFRGYVGGLGDDTSITV